MTISLEQMASDLDPSSNTSKASSGSGTDKTIESIETLIDSVRNIRAMTDKVMDARVRIDEILNQARNLQVHVPFS
ncbi:hypothetical protein LPJ78_004089 [Coemansia sp. RSA 989]|nr:hypothetical protein LPJ68_003281 [Coemansia sp. RSA 1086]KAJ1749315.1 hypothetical protein LPJ79_003808 [Coemansia sp. RSA 1821]KAJ1863356.1 hypothetical protein LPJ78_004089 [Coemansia sp. RSA 989]KAJ2649781.1 hypothetical protein IWW40_002957 [Coemansia sp. RSA 1250]